MIKRKYIDIALGIIFIILLGQFFLLNQQAGQCLANPFVYGADKITNENNNILCSCNIIDPDIPYAPFSFDKNNIEVQEDKELVSRDIFIRPS
jgi:hypothetical protein|tara:strand:- start:12094 stop:12372 length:279 start_codon:yes stop_codon:yes gene_type:complete